MMKESKGFVLRAEEWKSFLEDYKDDEVVLMLWASIAYFETSEYAEFSDRGMRQFFRQMVRMIDYDRKAYEKTCATKAHNRYKGECKKKGDEWFSEVYNKKQ